MKIGFFGNTNNYPFIVARALRKLGHEVLFIVDRSCNTPWELLYRPENRYEDLFPPYPDWIKDISPFEFWYDDDDAKKIGDVVSLLRSCDAVYLNQNGPSLLPYIQKPAIVHLTGSDLEVLANFHYAREQAKNITFDPDSNLTILRKIYYRFQIKRKFHSLIRDQRKGISSAVAVAYFSKGLVPTGDKLLDQLRISNSKRISYLLTDLDKIQEEPFLENSKVRIFNVARLNWQPNNSVMFSSPLDNKRTDILLRGIHFFFEKTKIALDVRLVKKGNDIEATQNLVQNLGIADQITWLDELSQLEVFKEYIYADIVTENLGEGQWSMGAIDAMATGRPVIANSKADLIQSCLGEVPPICHAQTPEEVSQQLHRLVLNEEERKRVGRESRIYAEKHFSSEKAAMLCLERLSAVVNNS